jgi:hypothetical protein
LGRSAAGSRYKKGMGRIRIVGRIKVGTWIRVFIRMYIGVFIRVFIRVRIRIGIRIRIRIRIRNIWRLGLKGV